MTQSSVYILSGLLALVPALVWLSFLFKKDKHRTIQLLMFFIGIFSVLPVFVLNIVFNIYPEIDFIKMLDGTFRNTFLHFMITLGWVSIVEELIKQSAVRYTDSKKLIIETLNDSIRYSLIAALGFSFAENLFYLYQIFQETNLQVFLSAYFFRTIFTTMGHLVFSGYFGYYYGLAKFSINIFEHSKWLGKKHIFSNFLAKFLNISRIQAYREGLIIKGMFIGMGLHTLYNYLLSAENNIPLAALLILVSFGYLLHIFKNRSSRLVLIPISKQGDESSMPRKDEEVVIELLGLWTNQKRYVDVIHICERLLKRDPGNQVVQLFKAKALDQIDPNSPYSKILQKMFPSKDQSTIEKYTSKNIN